MSDDVKASKTGLDGKARICVGVDWGGTEAKGFLGGTKKVGVDLDLSLGLFDENGELFDVVYYGQPKSGCGAILHGGDDHLGDLDGKDGVDNEMILVDLAGVTVRAATLGIVLNGFKGVDFGDIPFLSCRIYEGSPTEVERLLLTFDPAEDGDLSGKRGLLLGKFSRSGKGWEFEAIGKGIVDRELRHAFDTFARECLG